MPQAYPWTQDWLVDIKFLLECKCAPPQRFYPPVSLYSHSCLPDLLSCLPLWLESLLSLTHRAAAYNLNFPLLLQGFKTDSMLQAFQLLQSSNRAGRKLSVSPLRLSQFSPLYWNLVKWINALEHRAQTAIKREKKTGPCFQVVAHNVEDDLSTNCFRQTLAVISI